MNKKDAEMLARSSLGENIDLEYCDEPHPAIYGFNAEEEYLFTYLPDCGSYVGGSSYLAVSKESGKVRYLGFHGE